MSQSTGTARAIEFNLASLKWEFVKEGVVKTDLGGELPEVLVMTMSNEEFKKIHGKKKAAMHYLDAQNIFKRKLVNLVFSEVTKHAKGIFWVVIAAHSGKSTASLVAWQVRGKDKD